MKWLRFTLYTALLLLILCVVFVLLLVIFMNPDRLKPALVTTLSKQTGYVVTVDGHCSWSFYPVLGVKVAHMAFAKTAIQTPFIDLQGITFITKPAALLRGELGYSQFYIDEARLLNILLQHVQVGLVWKEKQLFLNPITASLYGGQLKGTVTGSALQDLPRWQMNWQATQVALQPLLQAVQAKQGRVTLSGLGDVSLVVRTQGNTQDQLLSNLNGVTSIQVSQGGIEGIDLNGIISSAEAIINRQAVSPLIITNRTTIDRMSGVFDIKNGIATTRNTTIEAPTFSIKAFGDLNLPAETMAWQWQIFLKKYDKDDFAIPVTITGNMTNPTVRLDVTELNIELAKAKFKNVMNKIGEELNKHFSGEE